ncbi:cell division protein [Escherichia coli]|nr:cell division protein [Escherichia coli]
MPEHDPVHKVTIIPRGRALGVTFFLPEGDAISASRQKLESQISTLYGGRLAEEIIYGPEHVLPVRPTILKLRPTWHVTW